MTFLDNYFKRPLLYDYLAGILLVVITEIIQCKLSFQLPKSDKNLSLISDLSAISLTLAGFILTFLTVIVTFKTAAKKTEKPDNSDVTLFDLFFNTHLYYDTTRLLKGAIKSLVLMSVLGLILKMVLDDKYQNFIFYFNIFWVLVIFLTMWRNLLILTKIINLQKDDDSF